MIKRMIFLFQEPITNAEIAKYNFDFFIQQNFDVRVFDLSPLLIDSKQQKFDRSKEICREYIYKIDSYSQLEVYLQETSNPIVIDLITGLSEINWKNEKVYRILEKHKVKFIIFENGSVPGQKWANDYNFKLSRLRKMFNLSKVFDFVIRQIIVRLLRYGFLYPKPARIFCTKPELLSNYLKRRNVSANCLVPINSYDYDVCCTYLRTAKQTNNNTCVFLDQALTNHPDLVIIPEAKIGNKEHYFSSMSRLFDKIEQATGLKVIIAGHPRAQYTELPDAFGNRQIIVGNTVELIANSSLVIAHFSTAVNYALIFDKPLLLVKTEGMTQNHFYDYIELMANAIGVKLVNIDKQTEFENLTFNYENWSCTKRDEYRYTYIMNKETQNITSWEILADVAKTL